MLSGGTVWDAVPSGTHLGLWIGSKFDSLNENLYIVIQTLTFVKETLSCGALNCAVRDSSSPECE